MSPESAVWTWEPARPKRPAEDSGPYLLRRSLLLVQRVQLHPFWGMDVPVRKSLPHAVPQWVADTDSFFVTINCEPRGQNHLCCAGIGDDVLAAAKFNHDRGVWRCRLILLMPDHLHAVIVFSRNIGLKTAVADWKKYLARTRHISWQKDFFDHRLRDHHQLEEKISYILMNPVRKGLCERAEDWPWLFRGDR